MLRFHAVGDWSLEQVAMRWVADGRRRLPAVEAAVDVAWREAGSRPGIHLFDGPMCRLESFEAAPARLTLNVSPTTYKVFVGTNMANPQFADEYGPAVMANPVGVSPALVTADGYLLLGRRNHSVAYYPGRVHPFAGSLDPTDRDVFAAVRRELAEELSLADADLADLRCSGIAEDLSLRQPEPIFAVTARVTRQQIEARLDPAEHTDVWAIPADAESTQATLANRESELTPVATAALLLWGRLAFGDAWFRVASQSLASAETL